MLNVCAVQTQRWTSLSGNAVGTTCTMKFKKSILATSADSEWTSMRVNVLPQRNQCAVLRHHTAPCGAVYGAGFDVKELLYVCSWLISSTALRSVPVNLLLSCHMHPVLLKAAFYDTDIDTDTDLANTSDTRDFLTRILARMSVLVSMSVLWNAALSKRFSLPIRININFAAEIGLLFRLTRFRQGAKYCDQRIIVPMSDREHILITRRTNFTIFSMLMSSRESLRSIIDQADRQRRC